MMFQQIPTHDSRTSSITCQSGQFQWSQSAQCWWEAWATSIAQL